MAIALSGFEECVILSVIVLVIAVYLNTRQRKAERNIKERCTAITSGVIDHTERSGFFNGMKISRRGLKTNYWPSFTLVCHTIYRYNAKDKDYLGIDARMPIACFKAGNPGDSVEIFYNPRDGREFYCPNEDKNIKYGWWILTGLIMITIAAVNIFLYFYDIL